MRWIEAALLNEIRQIPVDHERLQKSAWTIGAFLAILSGWFFWREKPVAPFLAALSIYSFVSAAFWPSFFKPAQIALMTVGIFIGAIMGRVLLTLLFYGLVTPLGLILKISGKKLLQKKVEKDAETYWFKRQENGPDKTRYERQY